MTSSLWVEHRHDTISLLCNFSLLSDMRDIIQTHFHFSPMSKEEVLSIFAASKYTSQSVPLCSDVMIVFLFVYSIILV